MNESRETINMHLGDVLNFVEKSLSAKPERRERLLNEAAEAIKYVLKVEAGK